MRDRRPGEATHKSSQPRLALGALLAALVAVPAVPAAAQTLSVPAAAGGAIASSVVAAATSPKGELAAKAPGTVITGLRYARSSPAQTLDLYLPPAGAKPVPLVILIHGGGFAVGDSSMEAPLARMLVRRGFAAASLNYRLSGEALFPAGARDVKAAVRWLRANAGAYGIAPGRFGVWGRSAGGWMAGMLGLSGNRRTLFDDPALGDLRVSSAVQAVVMWSSPVNFATLDRHMARVPGCARGRKSSARRAASRWLGADVATSPLTQAANLTRLVPASWPTPPFLLVHGDLDCTVPYGQSREMQRSLTAWGGRVIHRPVRGARHRDLVEPGRAGAWTLTFLRRTLGR